MPRICFLLFSDGREMEACAFIRARGHFFAQTIDRTSIPVCDVPVQLVKVHPKMIEISVIKARLYFPGDSFREYDNRISRSAASHIQIKYAREFVNQR